MDTPLLTGNKLISLSFTGLLALILVLPFGCAEQPVGYIYEPDEGQIVDLALLVTDALSILYDQADDATEFLDAASLTSNYLTILPEGWLPAIDTTGGWIRQFYFRNYLDQKFHLMWFDENAMSEAVRTPSEVKLQYVQVGSFQNPVTQDFYGDVVENRTLVLEYSDDRQNPTLVDGWMNITRTVGFVYYITVNTQGIDTEVPQIYYEDITWVLKIENFSVDPNDQRGRVIIDGTYPQKDEEDIRHEHYVSGVIDFDRGGNGEVEMKLDGIPVFKLEFDGRRGTGFYIKEYTDY